MTESGCRCQDPELLKEKPENCTSEQIRKCHGDAQEHPCIQKEDSDE